MRAISSGLNASLQQECTSLASLWQVTRTDGTVLRFTDAADDIVWNGNRFRADISFQASAIYLSISQGKAQTVTILFMMSDSGIKELDIRSRVYDLAKAEIHFIDYNAPQNGTLHIGTWLFSKVVISDKGVASVDLGPTSILGLSIGWQTYAPTCRATFGDARCARAQIKGGLSAIVMTPLPATDVLTFGSNPAASDTVSIGLTGALHVYTFKASLTGSADEVLIAGSALQTMKNLTNAINAAVGTGGYGVGTLKNTDVTATNDGATKLTISAIVPGVAGSNINATKSSSALTWAAATLLGGNDGLGVPFTVGTVINTSTFTAPQFIKPAGYFTQGFVQWTGGANAGTKFFVRANSGTSLSMVASPQVPVVPGDSGIAYPGCDKLPETCRDRWANEVNFRGECAVPTQSVLPKMPVITGLIAPTR
jgi:hypothetical protein